MCPLLLFLQSYFGGMCSDGNWSIPELRAVPGALCGALGPSLLDTAWGSQGSPPGVLGWPWAAAVVGKCLRGVAGLGSVTVTHWEGRGTPMPCPWCRAHGAVPTGLCPWCHPGVPPSERTPTHPGLTGTGALGLLACGIVFCHPISHPFPGPFLIWAARQ